MSGAASEHQALLASFAEEIEPLLAMLAGALDRLSERPDDATAATIGRAQVQTLQNAAGMLELTGFVALLDLVREALDLLAGSGPLSAEAKTAASQLAALILSEGDALGRGRAAPTPPAAAATLLECLRGAPPARRNDADTWESVPAAVPPTADRPRAEPISVDAWLDTLSADLAAAPSVDTVEGATPPAVPAEPAASADRQAADDDTWPGLGGPAAPLPVEPTSADAPVSEHAPAATSEAAPLVERPSIEDDTTEETIQPETVRALVGGLPAWAPSLSANAEPPRSDEAPAVEDTSEPPVEPGVDLAVALSTLDSPSEPSPLDESTAPAPPAPPGGTAAVDPGLQELLAGLAELTGEPLPADELAALGLGAVSASTASDLVSALAEAEDAPLAWSGSGEPLAVAEGPPDAVGTREESAADDQPPGSGAAALSDDSDVVIETVAVSPDPDELGEPDALQLAPALTDEAEDAAPSDFSVVSLDADGPPAAELPPLLDERPKVAEGPPPEDSPAAEPLTDAEPAPPVTGADEPAPPTAGADEPALPAASPILDYLGSVAASVDSLLETLGAESSSDPVAAEATEAPAGVGNAEALAVFAGEQGRLLEALVRARAALDAAPDDEAALMDLAWATHTLRGAASLVGADVIATVCGQIEQVADHLAAAGLPAPPTALAVLATAEEVLRSIVESPPDSPGIAAVLALLDLQFGEWQAATAAAPAAAGADPAAATAAWGELPSELAAQLEGVDLATVDEETLGRLAALLDAAPDGGLAALAAASAAEAAERAASSAADETTPAETAPLPPLAGQDAFDDWALPTDVASEPWAAPAAEADPTDLALDDAAFEAEVRAVFLAEAEEHLATINQALLALEASPADEARLIDVRRAVHTLKSASAAVGLEAISDFCHVWEDALDAVEDRGAASAPDLSLLLECAEALERYFRQVDDPTASAAFVSLAARLAAFGGGPRDAAPRASLAPRHAPEVPPASPPTADSPPQAGDVGAVHEPPADAVWDPTPLAAAEALAWEASVAEAWASPDAPAAVPTPPEPPPTRASSAASEAETVGAADVLRVPLRRVDGMIDLVGELVVQRSGLVQRLERLGLSIDELAPSLQRLRRLSLDLDDRFAPGASLGGPGLLPPSGPPPLPLSLWERAGLRPIRPPASDTRGHVADFDELELDRYGEAYQLARELAELAADLDTTRRELRQLLDDAQLAVFRSVRITADLHDALLDARLVPLAQLGPRLQRTVRQAALKSGKEVTYALEGGDTLLDKTLLEAIADPLLHLLRNAVDHGIEPPDERQRRGKPLAGSVRVCAWRDGQEVVVQVRDDGAGIDPARVIARARSRGLVPPDAPADAALAHELIFAPGFSTAAAVTDLSGRGMGLDAVRADLARVKGTVALSSAPARGTTFTLRVPALLVVTPALLVVAGGQRLAIPLAQVRRVLDVPPARLVTVGEGRVLPIDDTSLPVSPLGALLGWDTASVADDAAPERPASLKVIVVAVGERQVGLVVDQILGQQETVVKPPTPPFDVLPGVAGASVQGNGEVLLVLNLVELLAESGGLREGAPGRPARRSSSAGRSPSPPAEPPTVLVVDDSLSVRRVVTRTLQRHGWRVREARDGIQALDVIRETAPDVLLLDVEMPRMDGYELTSILKKQSATREIPIVMLTSRGGEKHRRKAFDLGVDAYLVKPYQESELTRVLSEVALAAPQGVA